MAHKNPKNITFKTGSHADRFEKTVKPDKHGHSDPLNVSEFHLHGLPSFGNGSAWARDDGSLAKKYKLVKRKGPQGSIISVATAGWAELSFDGTIAAEVYDYHKGKLCVVLAISSNLEMDHKDGRKHNFKPVETCDEFQPLSKAVNDAKRTHCNRCKSTNIRFDATQLGFHVPVSKGSTDYRGTCVGCYWHDPLDFVNCTTGGTP
jgi:hypothetical protein